MGSHFVTVIIFAVYKHILTYNEPMSKRIIFDYGKNHSDKIKNIPYG
jgi:hypothetical protein